MTLFQKYSSLCIVILLAHTFAYSMDSSSSSTDSKSPSSSSSSPRQQSMILSKVPSELIVRCLFAAKDVGCQDLIERLSKDFGVFPTQLVFKFVETDNGTQKINVENLRKTFIANAMIGADEELKALLHNPERKKLIENTDIYQALSVACILGHRSIIRCILKQYPNLDSRIAPKSRLALLCFAIKCNHVDIVSFMLEQNVFLTCLDQNNAIDLVISCAIDSETSQEMLKLFMNDDTLTISNITRALELITIKSEKVVATLTTLVTLQKQFKQLKKSVNKKKQ